MVDELKSALSYSLTKRTSFIRVIFFFVFGIPVDPGKEVRRVQLVRGAHPDHVMLRMEAGRLAPTVHTSIIIFKAEYYFSSMFFYPAQVSNAGHTVQLYLNPRMGRWQVEQSNSQSPIPSRSGSENRSPRRTGPSFSSCVQ